MEENLSGRSPDTKGFWDLNGQWNARTICSRLQLTDHLRNEFGAGFAINESEMWRINEIRSQIIHNSLERKCPVYLFKCGLIDSKRLA